MESTVKEIKVLRAKIDNLMVVIATRKATNMLECKLNATKAGMELPTWTEKAIQSLYLAKCWGGKALGILGDPSPYNTKGTIKNASDVKPTDAVGVISDYPMLDESLTYIGFIDAMRCLIQELIDNMPDYETWIGEYMQKNIYDMCETMSKEQYGEFEEKMIQNIPDWSFQSASVFQHLTEAGFNLGSELSYIKTRQEVFGNG